jgi:hypothetical protein
LLATGFYDRVHGKPHQIIKGLFSLDPAGVSMQIRHETLQAESGKPPMIHGLSDEVKINVVCGSGAQAAGLKKRWQSDRIVIV